MRYLLPAFGLLLLAVLLGIGLTLDPTKVPSPLIGQPAPAFQLPLLKGEGQLSEDQLRGQPSLVNFFASWCTPCLVEHPLLMRLAREGGVQLIGINYKDSPEDALRWLGRHGDPYRLIGRDSMGAAALDWGVYGVPETYLVSAEGVILYKQIGPMTEAVWQEQFVPRLGLNTP